MIDNPKSSRVKQVASLARKKERLARSLFLVEGPQAVRELLSYQPELVAQLYTSASAAPWWREFDRLAEQRGIEIIRVTETVLAAMADTVQPQGVIAVARIAMPSLNTVLSGARLLAILHSARDPGNAGAVLRAADAAGAHAVFFAGSCVDPWHPKVVRATAGSLFHLPVVVAPDVQHVAASIRANGLRLVAADVNGDVLRPDDPIFAQPIAWMFGNETRGIQPADRALAERSIRLPIYGRAESLNLAAAASVCLYMTAFAQQSAAGSSG